MVIAGEAFLVASFLLLDGLYLGYISFIGAAAFATLMGGYAGGVRGARQWLVAAVIIIVMTLAQVYLLKAFLGMGGGGAPPTSLGGPIEVLVR